MQKVSRKVYKELQSKLKEEKSAESEIAILLKGRKKEEIISIHSWRDGDVEIKLADIIFLQSYNANTFIHSVNGNVFIHRRALLHYQQLLRNKLFLRVHQSYLINKLHIIKIISESERLILMSNDAAVPYSMRNSQMIMQFIKNAFHSEN